MERARVLVADDKENILKLVDRILRDTYDVTTAPDGGGAISLIGSEEFDVVLTDLRMAPTGSRSCARPRPGRPRP